MVLIAEYIQTLDVIELPCKCLVIGNHPDNFSNIFIRKKKEEEKVYNNMKNYINEKLCHPLKF